MSASTYLSIARERHSADSHLVYIACADHDPHIHRYGDGESCRNCGTVIVPDTPGVAELDMRYANGDIDPDVYVETRDMLLGHP